MPAKSKAQQALFAIAENNPKDLMPKNKKILGSMDKGQMRDMAATKTKGLPKKVSKPDNFAY